MKNELTPFATTPQDRVRVYAFDFWITLTESKKTRELARSLFAQGHEVHIVTAISPGLPLDNDKAYSSMLEKLRVPFTAIHRVDHVPAQKVEVLKRIDADEFWDDLQENVDAAVAAGIRSNLVTADPVRKKTLREGFAKPAPVPKGMAAPDVPDVVKYPFYRCRKCHRVITYLEERKRLETADDDMSICSCGSRTYAPTNLVGLEHVLPRVLWFRFLNFVYDF